MKVFFFFFASAHVERDSLRSNSDDDKVVAWQYSNVPFHTLSTPKKRKKNDFKSFLFNHNNWGSHDEEKNSKWIFLYLLNIHFSSYTPHRGVFLHKINCFHDSLSSYVLFIVENLNIFLFIIVEKECWW